MSFEEKLDIVLKEIASIHSLSTGEVNILKRNALTRYNMYKDIKPNINKEETTFLKNTSDFGDVLINRLINNIRTYSLSRQFDSSINTKGSYTAKNQELKLESPASIKTVTMNKLSGRIPNVSADIIQKCVVKVFDHELGHVFQRAFTGVDGYKDSKFNQLINNLTVKYPTIFENKNSGDLKTIQGGMIPRRKDDSRQNIRKFYSSIAYGTHLDEIFNDSEATAVVGQTTPQFQYDHGNGLKQNIYNYESSYYRVTNHADMMKLLMGKVRTYRSMYEDSIETYEFFDQFINESNKAFANTKYAGKAPMLNVLNALDEAKNQRSTSASLRLDLFLTMCLQKKVAHELSNPNIDLLKLNDVVTMIKQFDSRIIKSDDHRLASENILADTKKMVEAKYDELKNANKLSQNSSKENLQKYAYFDIRKELVTISSRYHEMLTDNKINGAEINELITRLESLDKKVLKKQQEVAQKQEQEKLAAISEAIFEEKRKMEKVLMSIDQTDINHNIDKKVTI